MMGRSIAEAMSDFGYNEPPVDYLREIFVSTNADFPNQHHVFFEVGFAHKIIICGGCTDCSGAGSRGMREVESLFTLLELLSNVRRQIVHVADHDRKFTHALGILSPIES